MRKAGRSTTNGKHQGEWAKCSSNYRGRCKYRERVKCFCGTQRQTPGGGGTKAGLEACVGFR